MLGAAWFFFLRGTPLAERLARSGGSFASFVRYVLPLAFVVLVLIGAMIMTHDMGPLLIAGYGAGRVPRRVGRDVDASALRNATRLTFARWRCSSDGSCS